MDTKILECIGQVLNLSPEELHTLSPDDDLKGHGLHSMSAIQLIVLLEEVFGFEIDDKDLLIDNVSSLRQIEATLHKYGISSHE